ncbi:hypothetical protein B7P43_G10691 [Cryptotermes secundus]|uniref:Uncharacterized protein n=1 Tax=Cryptotermes secundus TaxID=105785 RepID=A0A2J7QMI1_9NEOP|nr:hypothetical protein B7P43_G10691 [Cryptotermes secundus]
MADSELGRLKRTRFTARAETTRFTTLVRESTASTPHEVYEYYRDRLRETLDQLISLDNDIQALLDNSEYTTDVEVSEEYIDLAKQASLKAKQEMENRLVSTGEKPNCKRVTDWKERIEKLKAKEEMLSKLDSDQAKVEADRKTWREELATSHSGMAKIKPETDKEMLACREMMEAHLQEEEKRTSLDRKPEVAQQEVPIEDAIVKPVKGQKKWHRACWF